MATWRPTSSRASPLERRLAGEDSQAEPLVRERLWRPDVLHIVCQTAVNKQANGSPAVSTIPLNYGGSFAGTRLPNRGIILIVH